MVLVGQLFLLRGQPIDSLGEAARADVAGLLRTVARPPGTINQHNNCVGRLFFLASILHAARADFLKLEPGQLTDGNSLASIRWLR